jgi:hypothetical protein
VVEMPANTLPSYRVRRRKRIVGVIAVVLLLIFTVLAILQYIPLIVWIIADFAVALIANFLFRIIGSVSL